MLPREIDGAHPRQIKRQAPRALQCAAMSLLHHALRAGHAAPPTPGPARREALVVGAGGVLGSAVLEQALARGGFARVQALTAGRLAPALRGFAALPEAALSEVPPLGIDTAFVVYDRVRHANGRDEAFHRPQPEALLPLAQALHQRGVRRLLIVLPQASVLLPQALKAGLASLDEAAVAALGFEHLLFLRPAQAPAAVAGHSLPQRVAHALLRQLHWMLPQPQQPVRAATVAGFAVALARALPGTAAGTRIVPAELVWHAAQVADADALAAAWLAGLPLPPPRFTQQRM